MQCVKCGSSLAISETWESSVSSLFETLNKLDSIWENIGFSTDQQAAHRKAVHGYLEKFRKRMLKEALECSEKLSNQIESGEKEMYKISCELGLDPEKATSSHMELPLLEVKARVLSKLNKLKEEKQSRERKYADLREHEQKICAILGEPTLQLNSSTPVPSYEDMTKLEEYIRTLELEKESREKEMESIRSKMVAAMDETEYLPETSFETSFVYSCDGSVLLSKQNLEEMKKMVEKANLRKLQMEDELASAKEKLETLWVRMGVSEDVKNQFLSTYTGCKYSVITAFQREILYLEETRKQNMADYINQMRIELNSLWDKCYISQDERRKCSFMQDDNYNEDLLEMYEAEVHKLKSFYHQNVILFTKIQEREQLWSRMMEFEKKSNDPNRYNNRGGCLLQEEKERNKLLRDFAKLEAEIVEAVQQYEESTGKDFLIEGDRFEQYAENKQNQFIEEREKQKSMRKRRSVLGDVCSNRTAFVAGKRPLGTPTATPNKHKRVNTTAAMMLKTPGSIKKTNTKVYPKSADPKTSKSTSRPRPVPKTTPRRKVGVKQNNWTAQNGNQFPHSSIGPKQVAFDENVASYAEFSEMLNNKTRSNFRSSCKYPLRSSKLKGKLDLPLLL